MPRDSRGPEPPSHRSCARSLHRKILVPIAFLVACGRGDGRQGMLRNDSAGPDSAAEAIVARIRVTEAAPGLLRQAGIPPERAADVAARAFPESRVEGARIIDVGGRLVYQVELRSGSMGRLVLVDAANGTLLASAPTRSRR